MNIKTIEEKAKAYDEALKRAEAAIDIAADKDLVKGVAITIFPELKESEDEGIRKDLIKYLKSCRDSLPCEDVSFYDSSIAWLEKQKAAENPKKGCPTYPLSVVEGLLLAKTPPAPIRFEQKQKPAEWSAEDERMINVAIRSCKTTIEDYPNDKVRFNDCIVWLKSLHPQPKSELTLLDKNIIKAAVAFIEQNDRFNYWRGIEKHTVIKALRSLRKK